MCSCNKITICTEFDAAQIAGLQVPIASIHAFATQTVPDGYLICDGSAISRTEYAELFAAVGTVWGAGDDATTFNIPDLRGEFMRGFDAGRGVDAGRVFASAQGDQFKSHQHLSGSNSAEDLETWSPYGIDSEVRWDGPISTYGVIGSANYSSNEGGDETRPRNVAITYAIKAANPTSA